jgi:hypothetical protein
LAHASQTEPPVVCIPMHIGRHFLEAAHCECPTFTVCHYLHASQHPQGATTPMCGLNTYRVPPPPYVVPTQGNTCTMHYATPMSGAHMQPAALT